MRRVSIVLCLSYLPNPSAGAGYDTRSIFKRSLTWLNSEFSFSETSCLTKTEEPSLPYYLPIAGGRIIGFIPFPRVLVLCEMQSVSSRIWTRVAVSISYDDNHYSTGTSIVLVLTWWTSTSWSASLNVFQNITLTFSKILLEKVWIPLNPDLWVKFYHYWSFSSYFIFKGFRTIVFIFTIISTKFRPICPPAFCMCFSNSGTFTELRISSLIKSMGVACSDSVSHYQVQVLNIPILLLACSQDWTCNLQMIVSSET